MSVLLRNKIPAWIISIIIVLALLQFYFNLPFDLGAVTTDINGIGAIVAAFAMILASVNIAVVYGNRIIKRSNHWEYAVVLLATLVITVITGLIEGEMGTNFRWIFLNVNTPIGATVFSLLGFYIVSAAYRAFRARTWEATVLLLTGAALIAWGAPLGHVIFPWIGDVGVWLLDVPNTSGYRGYLIGVAIAAVTLGVNLLLQKYSPFQSVRAGAGGE